MLNFLKAKIKRMLQYLRGARDRLVLCASSRKAIFSRYYQTNFWGGRESLSGRGSDSIETKIICRELPGILSSIKARVILDVPCGDFNWMKDINLPVEEYIGADIVAELIDNNERRYGRPGRRFFRADIVSASLPKADLILVRDALVHLSNKDVLRAIANLKSSGSIYLLTTTFVRHGESDIVTGQWRPINLEEKPFNFPKPLALFNEECPEGEGYADKSLGLWKFSDLKI